MKDLQFIQDWKDLKGYEGLYKISNYGKIYNCKSKKLIKVIKCKKYKSNRYEYRVCLYKDKKYKQFRIGKLVADHFVSNPYNYKYIYYIDGNPGNYKYNNIQWGTSNIDTKIVVDGLIFNTLKEYKQFCKKNEQIQYLMELNDRCDIQMPTLKQIEAEFKL